MSTYIKVQGIVVSRGDIYSSVLNSVGCIAFFNTTSDITFLANLTNYFLLVSTGVAPQGGWVLIGTYHEVYLLSQSSIWIVHLKRNFGESICIYLRGTNFRELVSL